MMAVPSRVVHKRNQAASAGYDRAVTAFDVPLWPDRPRPSMRVVLAATPRSDAVPAIVVFRGGAILPLPPG
jgi:hypothetical protein